MAKRQFQRRYRRGRPRRGVLLLVVMSLLVLFVLLGVTFAMLASQYKTSAENTLHRQDRAAEPRHELLDASNQVLRGTLNRQSVMLAHSLLEDLYGLDSVDGLGRPESLLGSVTSAVTPEVRGQYLRFNFTPTSGTFSTVDAFYNGAVLTMLDGPAKGHSTRVVGYDPGAAVLRVETFETDLDGTVPPVAGNIFLINGRAFNGLGFGFRFSGNNHNLDAVDPDFGLPVALQPNFSAYSTSFAVNVAGADESYDAPDYQNMLLGLIQRTDSGTVNVLPSLHRPALINYWMNVNGIDWWNNNPAFHRRVILRPLPSDHPNFTGSNPAPAFDPVNGPWDVDNDGDGVPDSIWVDLGAPIKTGPDGRRYKPLFAILCLDLDGRINLNAHGNGTQLLSVYADPVPTNTNTDVFAGGTTSLLGRYRGHGYGPADIATDYAFLNSGEHSAFLLARYARAGSSLPGFDSTDDPFSRVRDQGLPADYATNPAGYGSPPDTWGRGSIAIDPAGRPVYYFMGLADETLDDPYEIDLSHKGSHASGADAPFTPAELEVLLRFYDSDAGAIPSRMTALGHTSFVGSGASVLAALRSDRRRGIVTTESRHIPVPMVAAPRDLRGNAQLAPLGGRALHIIDLVRAKLLQANPGADVDVVNAELAKMLPVEMLAGGKMDLNRVWGNGVDDDEDGLVDEPNEHSKVVTGELAWTWTLDPDELPPGYSGVRMDHTNDDPLITNPDGARQIYARHLYCLMMFLIDLDSDAAGILRGYLHPTYVDPPLANAQRRELTARRIAQWAINVVDFRDPDSIMTPFEYDVNPYNGWTPNGKLDDIDPTIDGTDRRLVWGCEYADLLLTETVAFHDRRVKDTKQDNFSDDDGGKEDDPPQKREHESYDSEDDPPKEGDKDLDQFRIPQGSLFLELYCTRNRQVNNPNFPTDLYTFDLGDEKWKLDLGRLTPLIQGELQYPVWRAVITKHPADQASVAHQAGLLGRPDKITFQPKFDPTGTPPDDPAGTNMFPGDPDDIEIERIVWFTSGVTNPPTTHPDADVTYYNRSVNVGIEPGGYAVVGPRQKTLIGSKPSTSVEGRPSAQVIDLSNGTVRVTDTSGATIYPLASAKPPISIICGADPPTGDDPRGAGFSWPGDTSIGLNCSEPLPQSGNYYERPTHHPAPLDVTDGYYADPATGVNAIDATGYPDVPFDSEQGEASPDDEPPLFQDEVLVTGTHPDYKTTLLQRLADPTAPWHRQYNPYITVDWSIIDLTVYNGEDQEPAGWNDAAHGAWDPANDPAGPNVRFATRERGQGFATVDNPVLGANPWAQNSVNPVDSVLAGGATDYFAYNLGHTLGYLNRALGTPRAVPPGNLGDPDDTAAQPFPWLTWNNRPYSSHLELMLVPASSPQRLLHEFTLHSSWQPYNPAAATSDAERSEQFRSPYGHLLNFFQTHADDDRAAHFYRLFDYVEVPSRFVRAQKHYSPVAFANSADAAADGFRPPFNRRSRFRDPGRMNINTIADPLVWRALAHGFPSIATNPDPNMDPITGLLPDPDAFWFDLVKSRRGYGTSNGLFVLNPSYPTLFANPFRAAAAADLAPLVLLQTTGVEATLLRSTDTDPAAPTEPLFAYESTHKWENTARNPFFHYHSIQRLGNLVSTTSNVYAVWITVGYFEVEATSLLSDYSPPDGFLLGQELGSDTGDIGRHRMFMIVDRSIPVAFEPGQDHNVERAVLLRRFIE